MTPDIWTTELWVMDEIDEELFKEFRWNSVKNKWVPREAGL